MSQRGDEKHWKRERETGGEEDKGCGLKRRKKKETDLGLSLDEEGELTVEMKELQSEDRQGGSVISGGVCSVMQMLRKGRNS